MTDKLAGLVLPDSTPVERRAETPDAKAAASKKKGFWKRRAAPKSRARRAGSFSGGDWVIAGSGLALAFACAIFPWYIFFNKEDFGTRPVTFRDRSTPALPADGKIATPELVGKRLAMPLGAFPDLDMEATGTVTPGGARTASESEQPFPGAEPDFELVLVANGRAMIADKDGYWVVQQGSWLPDGSRVRALERRDGSWILLTSRGAAVPIAK